MLHVKETPTAIREISTDSVKDINDKMVYTLSGQRIHKDAVSPGTIVLVNGKKYLVK